MDYEKELEELEELLNEPPTYYGQELLCVLCAEERAEDYRKIDDFKAPNCRCGRHYEDGTPYGARYVRKDGQ